MRITFKLIAQIIADTEGTNNYLILTNDSKTMTDPDLAHTESHMKNVK